MLHSAACIKGITSITHPQSVCVCVCVRESAGSCQLGEAVIWHVSECVWANQTEGPL